MEANTTPEKELLTRIVRLETKLVRGFAELGIDLDDDNWIQVDRKRKIVYVNTLGRSIKVILKKMERMGAKDYGQEYDLYYNERFFGTIVYDLEALA